MNYKVTSRKISDGSYGVKYFYKERTVTEKFLFLTREVTEKYVDEECKSDALDFARLSFKSGEYQDVFLDLEETDHDGIFYKTIWKNGRWA